MMTIRVALKPHYGTRLRNYRTLTKQHDLNNSAVDAWTGLVANDLGDITINFKCSLLLNSKILKLYLWHFTMPQIYKFTICDQQ